MPQLGAIRTTRRTASAPARWPAARGPAAIAVHHDGDVERSTLLHKVIPKKKESTSAGARSADQRFHVVEVALERPPAEGGESVFRLGDSGLERFVARDVAGVLELARVDAEIAVARLEQGLELVEGETLAHRERADDREPHAFVNQPVELRRRRLRLGLEGSFRVCAGEPRRVALSHRTSVR